MSESTSPRPLAVRLVVAFGVLLWLGGLANAAPIVTHLGDVDPLAEGFGIWPFNGGMIAAPLFDDQGRQAWQITNTGTPQQAAYAQQGGTGPWLPGGSGLTQAQIDEIRLHGFTMSVEARVFDSPTYDPSGTQLVGGFASLAGFSSTRFDIGLAADGLGNTLVVLPSAVTAVGGSTLHYTPAGSLLRLAGSDYHRYELTYDPSTGSAALHVDGVRLATGYSGAQVAGGAVANNYGLAFGALDLGTIHFAETSLEIGVLADTPMPTEGTLQLEWRGLPVVDPTLIGLGSVHPYSLGFGPLESLAARIPASLRNVATDGFGLYGELPGGGLALALPGAFDPGRSFASLFPGWTPADVLLSPEVFFEDPGVRSLISISPVDGQAVPFLVLGFSSADTVPLALGIGSVAHIPEPTTWGLLGLGLLWVSVSLCRRRHSGGRRAREGAQKPDSRVRAGDIGSLTSGGTPRAART